MLTSLVLAGGGGQTGSTSFGLNSTMVQPTPLNDEAEQPTSPSYILYAGYWHTIGYSSCDGGDMEPDGDVDGLDLAAFVTDLETQGDAAMALADFAAIFGSTDCH